MQKIRLSPSVSSKFLCIVDHKKQDLAAIISSYIAEKDYYPLIFEFPSVTSANFEKNSEEINEHDLSRGRADDYTTFLTIILRKLPQVENLIIAGLSSEQKSYLNFLPNFNVIEITSVEEIDFSIGTFMENKGIINCKSDDILKGLNAALRSNSILKIDESAKEIELVNIGRGGVVLVEKEPYVATIIAINYAFSINSDVYFVDRATEEERGEILEDFSEYAAGKIEIGIRMKSLIKKKIEHIPYRQYDFSTFFTTGIPYSFAIENIIPNTYVNIHIRPDLFIANNILDHGKAKFGGAIVFSPGIYPELENDMIREILSNKNYFVKEYLDQDANIINLSQSIQVFPFDIFHICSHNKPVEGRHITEAFLDRDGNKHVIEYDRLLSFSLSLKKGHILVQQKKYWTAFDGMTWKSAELKAKEIPHYVFADMQNAITKNTDNDRIVGAKVEVKNSSGIQCSDGLYLGMFKVVASHSAPFVFNNTCWSWHIAAEPFLVGGTKSYIGTFWNVNNNHAVNFAKQFYNIAFSTSIMDAVYESQKSQQETRSQDIFMLWGLHFTKLIPAKPSTSRQNILEELYYSEYYWKTQLAETNLESSKDIIEDYITWIHNEILTTFSKEEFEQFIQSKKGTS